MVKLSPRSCALVGRLATPTPEKLGGRVEDKAKDFFREVSLRLNMGPRSHIYAQGRQGYEQPSIYVGSIVVLS